jgi:hypothetical protein
MGRGTLPLVAALCIAASGSAISGDPKASEILSEAIERAQVNTKLANETKYTYELVTVSEMLDENGEVEETKQRLYHGYPLEGVIYERLMQVDGRDLDRDERDQERKREEAFQQKLADRDAHRSAGKARRANSEDPVTFDQALASRYEIDLADERELAGRRQYVLSFAPREGPLPSRSRIDEVLNKASGLLWVDAESFEISRIEFELREKVNFWWGLIGSVSAMTGVFERRPLESEVWLPHRFELYMKGRKLVRPMHLRETFSWSAYARPDRASTPFEPPTRDD